MQENVIHNVIIESRKKISVSAVEDMECFDDEKVVIYTSMGVMTVLGKNFHINRLSLDTGEIIIEGDIDGVFYETEKKTEKQSFLQKLLG